MSRLQDELAKRDQAKTYTAAEEQIRQRYQDRLSRLGSLLRNKDFKEYLQLEEEMNDPKIVIAHNCTDPICMGLKQKVRDFWSRKRLLDKVQTNGAGTRPRAQSHRAS